MVGFYALFIIVSGIVILVSCKTYNLHKLDDEDLIKYPKKIRLFKSFAIIGLVFSAFISKILYIIAYIMVSREFKNAVRDQKFSHLYSDNKPQYKYERPEEEPIDVEAKPYEEVDRSAIYERLAELERQYKNHDIDEDYYKSQKEDLLNQIK